MEKIKFRAWCMGEMHQNIGINPNSNDYFAFNENGAITGLFGSAPEIMQYIGIEDVNGVEIYEGDIVKDQTGRINKIVFAKGYFFNSPDFNNWFLEECEVVGNIYENANIAKKVT